MSMTVTFQRAAGCGSLGWKHTPLPYIGNKNDVFLCCQEHPPPPNRLKSSGKYMHPSCLCSSWAAVPLPDALSLSQTRWNKARSCGFRSKPATSIHVLCQDDWSLTFSSSVLGQLKESDDTQQHFRKITSFHDQDSFFSIPGFTARKWTASEMCP